MGFAAKIMITGLPGCGKTTLFKKLAGELRRLQPVGFYTEEIRRGGVRTGFALRSFGGREGVLASVDFPGRHRVEKYGVDVTGFEAFLEGVRLDRPDAGLIMIDEIGKMECLSRKFQAMVKKRLDSDRMIIATIAQHGGGLIAEIKRREDVRIYALTPQNRDGMLEIISAEVENQLTKHSKPNTQR
jgi:nucleoside-triphosphatase